MKWVLSRNRNRIYLRMKRTVLLLVAVLLLASSVFFYLATRVTVIDRAKQADLMMLKAHKSASVAMQRLGYNVAQQIYSDLQVAYLLYENRFDPYELLASIKQLELYRMTLPYIESIYVYNGLLESITVSAISAGGYDIPLFEQREGAGPFFDRAIATIVENETLGLERFNPIPRRIVYPSVSREPATCYTFVVTDQFGEGALPHAVFVNFSSGWLRQMATESDGSLSRTWIVDGSGTILFSPDDADFLSDISQDAVFQRVKAAAGSAGAFVQEVRGEAMLVSHLPTDERGWHYVRLTPYSSIVADINRVAASILLVDGAFLLVGLLAALLVSKFLYIPVGAVNQRLDTALEETARVQGLSRQYVLRKMLLDASYLAREENRPHIEGAYAALAEASAYYVLFFRIHRGEALLRERDTSWRSAQIRALMEIAHGIYGRLFQVDATEMSELGGFVFVLSTAQEVSIARDHWANLYGVLSMRIREEGAQQVSCVVSPQAQALESLPLLFRQDREMMRHHIFYPAQTLLFAGDLKGYEDKEYDYPAARENRMIDAVMQGDTARATEQARAILWETAGQPFIVVSLAVAKVTMAITQVVREMQRGGFVALPAEVQEALHDAPLLDEVDSFEETVSHIRRAITLICESLRDKREMRHGDLLDRINAIIEEQYMDPGCGLSSIAQRIGMSAGYVGRLYKHYTLRSIPDAINETRMRHARVLLRESRALSISEVAQRTGYSSGSYFSKAFRKEHGVSPNEYRNYVESEEHESYDDST